MVGVILAGGAGRRLGGAKALRELRGRPLASYPARAMAPLLHRVALVGKADAELPALAGVELWDDEPAEPRHPAAGIAHALERAGGEPVLVCGADMPFVGSGECAAILEAARGAGPAVIVASADGALEPLLGVYAATVADALRDGAGRGAAMRALVAELDHVAVELHARALRSVNTPEALAAAARELGAVPPPQPRSIT